MKHYQEYLVVILFTNLHSGSNQPVLVRLRTQTAGLRKRFT